MGIVQVIIDDSTDKTITGVFNFDRAGGGVFAVPCGSSFPVSPQANEFFWRTDELKLYIRNGANAAWETLYAVPTTHATSHKNGGGDEIATGTPAANAIPKADSGGKVDSWVTSGAAAGTASLRTLGTGSTDACAGNDSRLSDSRTPTSHSTSHKNGGSDEVATATAANNAIPKAGGTGKLDIGWIPTGATGTTVCVGNDSRLSDSRTPTSHASSHNAGGGDALAIDAVAGTGSLRTLGTAATAACAGNDSRLSDARTDSNAIHKSTSAEISGLTEKTTLVGADVFVIEDSAASYAKKKVQVTNLPAGVDVTAIHKATSAEISTMTEKTVPVAADLLVIEDSADSNAKKKLQVGNLPIPTFGANPQTASAATRTTTTSASYGTKITITTGANTGTYLVTWSCVLDQGGANQVGLARLYNSTNATVLSEQSQRPSATSAKSGMGGIAFITLAGVAKTINLEFASGSAGNTTGCQYAYMSIWRIS